MDKLTALSKLASAYHYLVNYAPVSSIGDSNALWEIQSAFGYVRRSLYIEDLKPQPKCTEGLNGRGTTWL